MNDDDRVRYECDKCATAISGSMWSNKLVDKLDKHETDYPGHHMKEVTDDE